MIDSASAIGFIAGVLTTLSFVPQVIRTFRTKRADDLSYAMLLAFGLGVFLWVIHGVMVHSGPIIAANIVTLILVLVIAGLKLHYHRASRRQGSQAAIAQS